MRSLDGRTLFFTFKQKNLKSRQLNFVKCITISLQSNLHFQVKKLSTCEHIMNSFWLNHNNNHYTLFWSHTRIWYALHRPVFWFGPNQTCPTQRTLANKGTRQVLAGCHYVRMPRRIHDKSRRLRIPLEKSDQQI